jgi:hypothetical protein
MTNSSDRISDAPAAYKTARRPGQSGEENEHRAGPNPRSSHPTGPHAPYEPNDTDGLAAEKHYSDRIADAGICEEPEVTASGTIKVVDLARSACSGVKSL